MKHRGPSRTAINSAAHRAAHLILDAEPKIIADTFARAFAGFASDQEMLKQIAAFDMADFLRMRTLFAVRSRYAEDELAKAVGHGVAQYIILGAGLDSFAYRRPVWAASVEIFEIDHPASQAWKRARVAELGITSPLRLRHIPIDFECQALVDTLAASAVDLNRPVLLTLLGVMQYLTRNAITRLLSDLSAIMASGSALVFQFVVAPATLPADEAAVVTAWINNGKAIGEPWLSFFEPAEMERLCRACGFASVDHFGQLEATQRYLRDRRDSLRLPAYFHMMKAQVC